MLVSARPANLKTFVEDGRELTRDTTTHVATYRAAWDAFTARANEYGPADTGAMGTGESGALAYLLATWSNDETFVELVQHAFETADTGEPSVVQLGSWRVDLLMGEEARQRGIDLNALMANRENFTIADPQIAPVPQTSGFSNDPVCTATGHFVEQETDLVTPERLAALAWPRVYSSRLSITGGHGRGWGCWASARCVVQPDGSLGYTGPDGQQLRFTEAPGGGWRREPWIAATALPSSSSPGGTSLRWDWMSDHPGARWEFGSDGRLLSTWAPREATTTFAYDADGRLVRLAHEGGRTLDVHWDGERIARLVSSCGRQVSYRYDSGGDLIEVVKAKDPYRYELDADGRIAAVWDGDGVRLCHNTYDEHGRVERQVSPFGRETIFTYERGRVTVVSDTEDGPESRWEHDRYGRLVALVNDDGDRLSRAFDTEGRCVAVTGLDGATVTNRFDDHGRLVGARHSTGGEEHFERDECDRLTRYVAADGATVAFEYGDDGAVPTRITGPEGWEVRLDVDDGLVRAITDADGVTIAFDYDADGCPMAVRDGLGHTTRMTYHPSGELTGLALADGTALTIERDDAGRPRLITLPTGERIEQRWSGAGRPVELVQPNGATETIEYASHGAARTITDALGRVVELRYDHLQHLVGMSTGDGRKWEWSHTAMGLVAAEHDPAGHMWLFDYDRAGRGTGVVDPLGRRTAFRYDTRGELVETVDETGAATRYERDEHGRVVAVIDGAGGRTGYRHDPQGRIVEITTPDGGVVHRRFSRAGRLIEERTSEGRFRRYVHDGAGRLAEVIDANGSTRYECDAVGRPVAVTTPAGRVQRLTYDPMGQVAAVEVGGFRWTATYDHAGRLTSRTDPLGATTRFDYDAVGNLIAATDPLGHTTRYRWDDRNVCVATVDPLGGVVRRDHDARRLLTATTDALGHVTRYERDGAGRVVAVVAPTGQRAEYRRDKAGRIRDLRVDGRDVLVRELDGRGRPVIVHEPGPNRTHTLVWSPGGRLERLDSEVSSMAWRYDSDGVVVERVADRRVTSYGYDPAGQLLSQHDGGDSLIEFRRDADGRVVALTGPGLDRQFRYDEAARVVERTDRRVGATTVAAFEYDGAGRIVAIDHDGARSRYRYDTAGQLVGADAAAGSLTFGYDEAGRLVAEGRPDGERLYRYDAAHRLTAIDGVDPATFAYDARGRRARRTDATGTTYYGWDPLGRLASIEHEGERSDLDVDAFGSLVEFAGVRLQWDPVTLPSELLAIGDRRVVVGAGVALGLIGTEGVEWLAGAGAGGPGATGRTDPWGAARSDGASPALGFMGELDLGGLCWLRHRVYEPATRQFLSPDPLAGIAGTPVANFPYHYAGNDPIGAIDPLGLQPVSMADFQQYKDQATGVQWGNVVNVIAGVVGTAIVLGLAATGIGAVALLAISAGVGAVGATSTQVAQQVGDQGRGWGDLDWTAVGRSAATGAAFSMLGAGTGRLASMGATALGTRFLGSTVATSTAFRMGTGSATGAGQGFVFTYTAEALDLQGDGQFNPYVVPNVIIGAAGGAAGGYAARGAPPPQPWTTPQRVTMGAVPLATVGGLAFTAPDPAAGPAAVPVPPVPSPVTFPDIVPDTYPLAPEYSRPGSRPVYNPGPPGTPECTPTVTCR